MICGTSWARILSYLTPILVHVAGRQNIDKKKSYVIVCNHQSHYDILVLYGFLGVDFKWVMKSDLRKVPFLGVACDKLGHIFIDRSKPMMAVKSINKAKKKIVNGTSVIFFPEGTRTSTGKMGKFKKGAFRFACDLGIPILPITIQGTRAILPKGTSNLMPGKAIMTIHPPVDTDQYSHDTILDLMEKVRAVILEGIKT